jgi:hypothetical protein
MSGGIPIHPGLQKALGYGTVTSTSIGGTTITTPATANTNSAWVSLGITTQNSSLLEIDAWTVDASYNYNTQINIGVGTSGSQSTIVSQVFIGTVSSPQQTQLTLPIEVAAGTNLWAQAQTDIASAETIYVQVRCHGGGFVPGFAGAETIGIYTAQTIITAGSSANTMGSWTQISPNQGTGGILHPWHGFYILGGVGTAGVDYLFNIGIGASGSQQIIIPNVSMTAIYMIGPYYSYELPAGTNIWAQCQCSTASDQISIALMGVY